jgi:hypothetical protein
MRLAGRWILARCQQIRGVDYASYTLNNLDAGSELF